MTTLIERYQNIRQCSRVIATPLSPEDCAIQSMPDVSPTRWHLAHTTWFFETFLLKQIEGYQVFHPQFEMLFNSYYNSIGEQFPRDKRGLISRPGLNETMAYRAHVDAAVVQHFSSAPLPDAIRKVFEIGLQHEQQHQELMLTDIKHVLSQNPLQPIYRDAAPANRQSDEKPEPGWKTFAGGLVQAGQVDHSDASGHDHAADQNFCFDNELPQHSVFLHPFSLSTQLVTNGQFLDFINDGGYQRPELWLSAGWATAKANQWTCPLYWHKNDDARNLFTLAGTIPLDENQPVCHLSYFEADAFARWAGHRLPTEFEWEHAVTESGIQHDSDAATWADQRIDQNRFVHPHATSADSESAALQDAFGQVWEWTASQYTAYPGYQPPDGALGEYNGKFMCNQFVLRGGSCATPSQHIRSTYRNFFPPDARWQFTGLRLASR